MFPNPHCRTEALSLGILILLAASAPSASPAEQPKQVGLPLASLQLANGDFAQGELHDSSEPGQLRWQAPGFTRPFTFPLDAVRSVHFPVPDQRPEMVGSWAVETTAGDFLSGAITAISEDYVELDSSRFGPLHIKRNAVQRILRWGDTAGLLYVGPHGLAPWSQETLKYAPGGAGWLTERKQEHPDHASGDRGWREEAGKIISTRKHAALYSDLGIPARASIEIAVSWERKPVFSLVLGAGESEQLSKNAYRIEAWGNEIVALRETEHDADITLLQTIEKENNRFHIQAFLDQEQDRLVVLSQTGKRLAELQVETKEGVIYPGLRLLNHHGDLRLEELRIMHWKGELPVEAEPGKARVHRTDGSIVYGHVKAYDLAADELVLLDDGQESRLDVNSVHSVVLSAPAETSAGAVRVVLQDGTEISGKLTKIEDGRLSLKSSDMDETLSLPASDLHALFIAEPSQQPPAAAGRVGRLEMSGLVLSGDLVEASEPDALVWQPRSSVTASPIRGEAAAKLIYRASSARSQPVSQRPVRRQNGLLGGLIQAFSGSRPSADGREVTVRSLHLRTGDMLPCEVERIDQRGVIFTSDSSDATFVPHEKMKAVELASVRATDIQVDEEERRRLMTVPRMQQNNPPTHLICSTFGDYLRARLIEMDEDTLTVEVRLETKQIPRDRVARIIWLHSEELDASSSTDDQPDDDKPVTGESTDRTWQVQALRSDGNRITFTPLAVSDDTLIGKSDLLGNCRLPLNEIDKLLIGSAIESEAAELAYQQWKLHNATLPKYVTADSNGEGPIAGTESAMVGKTAPDFKLELLGGQQFRLSDQKGQIIVLDFWATWCGPCIQAMPQVEGVVKEFADQGVKLVAINLQEDPQRITATLKRLGLEATVALDRDGVVAHRYSATAIPQTVVIDREGIVTRLYVGGGNQLSEQLRQALASLVGEDSSLTPGRRED